MSKEFKEIYEALNGKIRADEPLRRKTLESALAGRLPRSSRRLMAFGSAAACTAAAVATAVLLLLPKGARPPIADPSGAPGESGFATSSSDGASVSDASHGEGTSSVTSGTAPGSSSSSGGTASGVAPPTGTDTIRNIPRYIGYRTSGGASQVIKTGAAVFPRPSPLPPGQSLLGRPAALETKQAAGKMFVGQATTLTLLLENRERDAIVDVLMDDSEYGVNTIYSSSATKYKIVRVDTEYQADRKTFVTEVELQLPPAKKAGERTIVLREIGFLRSYMGKDYTGKCELGNGAAREFTYQVTKHPLTDQGYTIVTTPDQLNAMRGKLDGKYALGGDIDLRGQEWTPVGTKAKPFTGTFDGCGYTIFNYTIRRSPETPQDGIGLFGNAAGVLQNVTVDGTVAVSGAARVGGVVGTGRKVVNCHNRGTVTVSGAAGFDDSYGGVAGYAESLSRCSNTGKVTSLAAGYAYVGGVAGQTVSVFGMVTESFNRGQVTAAEGAAYGISVQSHFQSCYNTGDVSCANGQAGGIGGSGGEGNRMQACYSTGKIQGTPAAGLGYFKDPTPTYDSNNFFGSNFWLKTGSLEPYFYADSFPHDEIAETVTEVSQLSDLYAIAEKLTIDGQTAYKNAAGRPPKLKWEN